jgi:hypothetical protein
MIASRALLAACALLVMCMTPATTAASTPIIPDGTWSINANGYVGVLEVTSIDIVGNLTGTLFGTPITGYWDGSARRMTFETKKASIEIQVYTGYLVQEGPTAILAGSFEAFSGTGATATRDVYAWRAEGSNTSSGSLVAAEAPYPAPFPASFNVVANGQKGTLAMVAVDAQNGASGTLFGKPVKGFWNPFERKLTFIWYGSFQDPSELQVYSGYLIGSSTCRIEANCRLAGSFEAFSGTDGVPQRNVYGWVGTLSKS